MFTSVMVPRREWNARGQAQKTAPGREAGAVSQRYAGSKEDADVAFDGDLGAVGL